MPRHNVPERSLSEARADLDVSIDASVLAMSEAGFSDAHIAHVLDSLGRTIGDLLTNMEGLKATFDRMRGRL